MCPLLFTSLPPEIFMCWSQMFYVFCRLRIRYQICSSELRTNNRLLSLYDCSVRLIGFGSADIDPLTCRTASCRPHPYACFSCNGTIGVLLSERGPSPLITCCCCFYICHSWYSAHMGIVLRNTTSPNQFIYKVSLP